MKYFPQERCCLATRQDRRRVYILCTYALNVKKCSWDFLSSGKNSSVFVAVWCSRLSKFHYSVVTPHLLMLSVGRSCIWQHDVLSRPTCWALPWRWLWNIPEFPWCLYGNKVPVRSWLAASGTLPHGFGWFRPTPHWAWTVLWGVCVCASLVFCWIALSKQVERPVVMRATQLWCGKIWERERPQRKRERSE